MKVGFVGYPVPPEIAEDQKPHWLIDRAAALGVDVVQVALPRLDPTYLDEIRAHLDDVGLDLETNASRVDYAGSDAVVEADIQRVVATLEAAARLHIPIVRTTANNALHNRFTASGLEGQLANYIANLTRVEPVARANGIILAAENHCDYRGDETARIIEAIDSPWIRVALDTGNAYTVFDEPVNDVRHLARYTATTHLKDMKIIRWGEAGQVPYKPVGCALGDGHVDLETCVRVLAEQAPDPESLRLIIEINWAPGGSTAEMFERSIAYIRENFAIYLGLGLENVLPEAK